MRNMLTTRKFTEVARGTVFLVALSACYSSKLSPAGAKVRATVNAETVRGCESLGIMTAKSGQGELLARGAGASNVDVTLKNKTAKLGGNTILVADQRSRFGGASGRGEAYKCAEVGK